LNSVSQGVYATLRFAFGETRFIPFYELLDMTATIRISCPSCNKNMVGPAAAQGKKIKCKACNHVFVARGEESTDPVAKGATKSTAKAPAPKGKAQPGQPKPEVDKNRLLDPEDVDPGKGYGCEEAPPESVARCPQCAYEMESEEAIVCLTCGYNLLTRTRLHMKKVYETSFMDWVFWLTPSISSTIFCISCLLFAVFLWTGLKWWFGDWWFCSFPLQVWFSVFALAGAWYSAKFAFKRFVYEFRPPENVKKQ
jgi:DNA-directed RNA polymerase subunit M/transcription elongation factor TFIIS